MWQHLNHRDTRRIEEEEEIESLFEKIMKENFPSLAKEIDLQVQEAQSPIKLDLKRTTQRHIVRKMPKVKDKENLKSSKEKAECYLQRSSHKTVGWFLKRNFAGYRGQARSVQSDEKQ